MRIVKMASHSVLVALALVLSASVGKSQVAAYKGTFTLPFEVRWGGATLPAGDYTLRMDHLYAPSFIYLGETKSAAILAGVPDTREISNPSRLLLVETAHGYAVQSLELHEIGLRLDFTVPKRKAIELANSGKSLGTTEVAVRPGH